jgi:hypothetical protein
VSGIGGDESAVPPRVPDDASEPLNDTASGANAAQPPREECASKPFRPEIRPAAEPTCCGSGCDDCPF